MTDEGDDFPPVECPTCHADLTGKWIEWEVEWTPGGVVRQQAPCPECGGNILSAEADVKP